MNVYYQSDNFHSIFDLKEKKVISRTLISVNRIQLLYYIAL